MLHINTLGKNCVRCPMRGDMSWNKKIPNHQTQAINLNLKPTTKDRKYSCRGKEKEETSRGISPDVWCPQPFKPFICQQKNYISMTREMREVVCACSRFIHGPATTSAGYVCCSFVILKCCQEINREFRTMGTASSPCELHQWTPYLKNFRGFFLRMILARSRWWEQRWNTRVTQLRCPRPN